MKLIGLLLFPILVASRGVDPSSQKQLFPSRSITNARSTLVPTTKLVGKSQCSCVAQSVWVDVMLLFDSSINAAKNSGDFMNIVAIVKSHMAFLNIQTAASFTQHHSRIGVISYGNQAHLMSSLGELNNVEFQQDDVFYTGEHGTNISDAFRLSVDQLSSINHRPNVRPVIVLVANTFTNGQVSPLKQAEEFKNMGGIIMVYYFDPIVKQTNLDILQQLASPGYFIHIVNEDFTYDNPPPLITAMCDANCFCPDYSSSMQLDPTRKYPIAGCFTSSQRKANQQLAFNNCKQLNWGFLSTSQNSEKSEYLESLIGVGNIFWLGLTYDKYTKSYVWSDGTTLNGTWHPWADERASSTDACVVEETMKWYHVPCYLSHRYLCEAAPCSSTVYCGSDE